MVGEKFQRGAYLTGFVLLPILLSACSISAPHQNLLLTKLRNRGPVALSADNPYLAANAVVAREMQASTEVRGFIQHRGAPAAIEINQEYFSPIVVNFYYPSRREVYRLEGMESGWIIRGPEEIARPKMKELAHLTRAVQGEPKLAENSDLNLNASARLRPHVLEEAARANSTKSSDSTPFKSEPPNDSNVPVSKVAITGSERSEPGDASPEKPTQASEDPTSTVAHKAAEDDEIVRRLESLTREELPAPEVAEHSDAESKPNTEPKASNNDLPSESAAADAVVYNTVTGTEADAPFISPAQAVKPQAEDSAPKPAKLSDLKPPGLKAVEALNSAVTPTEIKTKEAAVAEKAGETGAAQPSDVKLADAKLAPAKLADDNQARLNQANVVVATLETLARSSGDHPAELSPKGDLVHYVTYPGESLEIISRWYTFDEANRGAIARINNVEPSNSLAIGDTIVVPAYLLRNKNRLDEPALKAVTVLIEQEEKNPGHS